MRGKVAKALRRLAESKGGYPVKYEGGTPPEYTVHEGQLFKTKRGVPLMHGKLTIKGWYKYYKKQYKKLRSKGAKP